MRTILILVVILSTILCSRADTCGGNCPSGACQTCQCGLQPSYVNISEICSQFPGWDSKCCECIVRKESLGNEKATYLLADGSYSVGLWQINSAHWDSCGGKAPCSFASNLDCAVNLWKQGGGSFKKWSSCADCGCCASGGSHSNIKRNSVTDTDAKITKPIKSFTRPGFPSQPTINVSASNCGGNCPGGNCDSCPCGTTASPQNIASVCSMYSAWDQSCCQCVVKAESGGNANAVNENSNGSFDVGVWQINSVNWRTCSGNTAPCAVAANLQCAQQVWKNGGNSFKQWTTCTKCGCCGSTTGTATTNSVATAAATHAAATHAASATTASSQSGSTSSTYGSAALDAQSPKGGHGNLPLDELVNVVFKV